MLIILDPGHGGLDRSGNSSPLGVRGPEGTLEKDVTLRLARRLSEHLGTGVALTRYGDSNPSLGARAEAARRNGARVFVSLHANSGAPGSCGTEIWVHARAAQHSRALAHAVQGALARLGGPAHGIQHGEFAVLTPERLTPDTAACLVEVDFLSDPQGERRLGNPGGLESMARALAQGIRAYLGEGRVGGARTVAAAPRNGQPGEHEVYGRAHPALARAQSSPLAASLMTVAGSATSTDADLVGAQLDIFPEQMLQALSAQGTRLVVCRNSVTDYMTSLRGVRPRGWPAGSSWDTVPGLNSTATNEVVIATIGHGTPAGARVPRKGEGHGADNLVLHESTHAIDLNQGGMNPARSSGPNFQAARTADFATLSTYEQQPGDAGLQETYAESSARYFGSAPRDATEHPNLHDYWPVHMPGPWSDPNS